MAKRKYRKNKTKIRLTPNQSLYNKERDKLLRRIRYQKSKGYDVPEDIIPERPKRIYKEDIEELKNIRAKQIKEASEYIGKEKQEEIPTFDYIHAVEEIIDNLPSTLEVLSGTKGHYKVIIYPLYEDKEYLKNLLWDTANEYETYTPYNEYLETVYGRIQAELNPDFLPSTEEELHLVISMAIRLIKGRSLTMEEAQLSNYLQERM